MSGHPRSFLHITSLFSLEGIKAIWILVPPSGIGFWKSRSNKFRNLKSQAKIGNGPIAQSRLERTPDKREVVGSIPTRPTIWIDD